MRQRSLISTIFPSIYRHDAEVVKLKEQHRKEIARTTKKIKTINAMIKRGSITFDIANAIGYMEAKQR